MCANTACATLVYTGCPKENAPNSKYAHLFGFKDFTMLFLFFVDQEVIILDNTRFLMYSTILGPFRASSKWGVFSENPSAGLRP